MMTDEKKEKPVQAVKGIDDMNSDELRKELLRKREEIASLKNQLQAIQRDFQQRIDMLSVNLQAAGEREAAHLAALKQLSRASEKADMTDQRFDAIAKDIQLFTNNQQVLEGKLNTVAQSLAELTALVASLKEPAQ